MVICFKTVHTGLVDNMKAGVEAECTPKTAAPPSTPSRLQQARKPL